MNAGELILVDGRTGRVTGGRAVERAGIAVMRAAIRALWPLGLYGYSRIIRLIGRALPGRSVVRVALSDDASFDMPYADPYWSLILPRQAPYEEDVRPVLEALADMDYVFVDCGANYGYWSVLVSSPGYGGHPVVAIEAAPDTFAWLGRNAEANGGRFATLNRAVAEQSGATVAIYGARHESRSMLSEEGVEPVGRVETLALDDLLERPELGAPRPILLKLDVEGAEIDALDGARRMLERDVLVVYEDHGSDREHTVSAHVAGKLGMRLFAADASGVRPLDGLGEMGRIKRNRRWGYDFFATRSPVWLDRMERLVEISATPRAGTGT